MYTLFLKQGIDKNGTTPRPWCAAGEVGEEAAGQLEEATEEDMEQWLEKQHKEEERAHVIGKLREDILAEEEGINTEPAETGTMV